MYFSLISFVFDVYSFTYTPPAGAILSLTHWRAGWNPSFKSA
jgi:hypothetical protein